MINNFWLKNYNIDSMSNDKILGVISHDEFLKSFPTLENKNNIVLISILYKDSIPHNNEVLESFLDAKEFVFDDATFDEPDKDSFVISDDMAKSIKDFILKNKDSLFLIHCSAGKSRSAGVAKAVECLTLFDGNKYYYTTGHSSDIDLMARYTPNLVVYDKILNS